MSWIFNPFTGNFDYTAPTTAETDPVFVASPAYGITNSDITNWNTAYGWGDHAGLYDTIGTASGLIGTHESTYNHANYDTAYGWGDHALAGYLTSISGQDHGTLSGLGDKADHSWALTIDGARGLTANWDAGSFKITSETLESDIATGTAPLIVASTTKVANLNADLLDSQEGSYYLDSANYTGTEWDDLTDGGETNLHIHDDRYYTETEISSTTLGSSGASLVGLNSLDGTATSVQLSVDGVNSSMYHSGGLITENSALDGTIDISECTGAIKTSADNEATEMGAFTISALVGQALSSGKNIICVDYSLGTPAFSIETSEPNHSTVFPLGSVYKDDESHLHILQEGHSFLGMPWKTHSRLNSQFGLVRTAGIVTTEATENLHLDVSAGTFWKGINEFSVEAYDGDETHDITGGGSGGTISANNTIVLDSGEGDVASHFGHGKHLVLQNSSNSNNGCYHVESSSYAGSNTTIIIEETSLNTGADTGHIDHDVFAYWHYDYSTTSWVQETRDGAPCAASIDVVYWNDIDNATEFQTFTSNRYGAAWVYREPDGDIHVVYGQGNYTLAQVLLVGPPATLPDIINVNGFLIAKIVFQEGDTSFYDVFYPWTTVFSSTGASDHGGLAGLDDVADHPYALLIDGTRALTSNWDAGSFKITALTFESDQATGTAPLTVASTTKVSNLNVDLLDDQTGSYYLDSDNFTGTEWTDLTDSGETTLHIHDGRYYTETELDGGQLDTRYFTEAEHINSSAGAGDAGKPIKLDVAGHIDSTMINDGDIAHSSLTNLDYASAGHTGFEPTVSKGNVTAGSNKISLGGTPTGAAIGVGFSIDVTEGNIDHDSLTNYEANEHFVQTAITNISTALATGLLKVTTGTGALSVITDSSTNWDLAHAHISESGASHTYIDQSVISGATPTFTGTNFSGIPASALPNADDDGVTKGVCTFDNTDFNATAGVVTIEDSGIDHDALTNTHNLTTDIDHGAINGLGDDDHTQYVLRQPTAHTNINLSEGGFNFNVATTGQANALMVLGTNGKVGIGEASPLWRLTVAGSIRIPYDYSLYTQNSVDGNQKLVTLESGGLGDVSGLADTAKLNGTPGANGGWQIGDSNTGIAGKFSTDAMQFITNNQEKLRLGTTEVAFNEDGLDINYRFEGTGQANALFVQGSDGYVGIGTGTPTERLEVAGNCLLETTGVVSHTILSSEKQSNFRQYSYISQRDHSLYTGFAARGTKGTPLVLVDNDQIFSFRARGYDGTGFINSASIIYGVDGTPGTNDMPGRITFNTTPSGSNIVVERMRIDNAGNVGIGNSNPQALLSCDGDAIFNESGADKDFRIEGVGQANALFVQGSDGFSGFNTNTPATQVEIIGGTLSIGGAYLTDASNQTLAIDAGTGIVRCSSLLFSNGNSVAGAHTFASNLAFDGTDGRWEYTVQSGNVYGQAIVFNGTDGSMGTYNTLAAGANGAAAGLALRQYLTKEGRMGFGGVSSLAGQVHIDQASTTAAIPVLVLDQGDIDDTFINYIGTSAADGSRSISSDTTEDSAKAGAFRIEINGVVRWVRFYDDHS